MAPAHSYMAWVTYLEEQQKMESRGYKTAETFDSVSDMTDWYGFRVYEIERGECDFS